MISVNYRFMPLRLVLRRKQPVQLIVYVKNTGNKEESVVVKVVGESGISFSKGGLKNVDTNRMSLQPNEGKQITFEVHPTARSEPKYYELMIQAKEYIKNEQIGEKEITTEIKVD